MNSLEIKELGRAYVSSGSEMGAYQTAIRSGLGKGLTLDECIPLAYESMMEYKKAHRFDSVGNFIRYLFTCKYDKVMLEGFKQYGGKWHLMSKF